MKKSFLLWFIAFILTAFTAVVQRITGPTYPISGETFIDNRSINYKLEKSHSGNDDHLVKIKTDNISVSGLLQWKRFNTDDDWNIDTMSFHNGYLTALLPHQPPAGKLLYKIILKKDNESVTLPDEGEVVIRFKGEVPMIVLIPHIIFIFCAMLFSTRTGLEYFAEVKNFKTLTILTFVFIIIGGFILGPIAQYYAFNEFWTGFPVGYDLTDNKILIGFICWLIALIALYKLRNPVRWIIFASIIMFIIFLIPHSLLGSELDYKNIVKQSTEQR